MIQFEYEGNQFQYIPYNTLLDLNALLPKRKDYKQSKFLDMGAAFDIETSKVPNENLSFMYMWQFAISNSKKNAITIIGRTWEELIEFLKRLSEHYELKKKPLLVWVMNFSYEWQFIKRRLHWKVDKRNRQHVFALTDREVVRAMTDTDIEFRDAYILTQMGLNQLTESFQLNVKKLSGQDFNYKELRFPDTQLTNGQLAYGINDVLSLCEWYWVYIKPQFIKNHIDIPLTSTGIVRQELKRNFKKWNRRERLKYKKKVNNSFPAQWMYEAMISWLFRGGYTHANAGLADNIWINLGLEGQDIKSSYPAIILHDLVPYEFVERPVEWFDKYGFNRAVCATVAYFGTFVFTNIRSKSGFSFESENKIVEYSSDAVFDNGRLLKASSITVVLNEVDMLQCYDKIYEWDKVECLSIYRSDKEPFPTFIKDLVLKYFCLKETMRDNPVEYMLAKRKLNSIYGMLVTSLFHTNLSFDENLGIFVDVPNKKTFEELAKEQILLPQHGIWVTSYARANLVNLMVKCDSHHTVYDDTDSLKILNSYGCSWAFKDYNDRMHRINSTMYVGKYERSLFREIGCYEFESKYFKFKTLGSKRYIYDVAHKDKETGMYSLETNVTIAGMKKGTLQKHCKREGLDIYKEFRHDLKLDSNESEKLTSVYEDSEWTRKIEGRVINEKSCVCLVEIPFHMSLTADYIALVAELHEHNMRVYGNRF